MRKNKKPGFWIWSIFFRMVRIRVRASWIILPERWLYRVPTVRGLYRVQCAPSAASIEKKMMIWALTTLWRSPCHGPKLFSCCLVRCVMLLSYRAFYTAIKAPHIKSISQGPRKVARNNGACVIDVGRSATAAAAAVGVVACHPRPRRSGAVSIYGIEFQRHQWLKWGINVCEYAHCGSFNPLCYVKMQIQPVYIPSYRSCSS